jgi:hypothetical protein
LGGLRFKGKLKPKPNGIPTKCHLTDSVFALDKFPEMEDFLADVKFCPVVMGGNDPLAKLQGLSTMDLQRRFWADTDKKPQFSQALVDRAADIVISRFMAGVKDSDSRRILSYDEVLQPGDDFPVCTISRCQQARVIHSMCGLPVTALMESR